MTDPGESRNRKDSLSTFRWQRMLSGPRGSRFPSRSISPRYQMGAFRTVSPKLITGHYNVF